MVMIFTIVSAVQEFLNEARDQMIQNIKDDREKKEREAREAEEVIAVNQKFCNQFFYIFMSFLCADI